MYYVVFALCALCDARSLSVPRWMLLVLCLAACFGAGAGVSRALSGLLLALPVYRLVIHNRCGIGDSAGACALGGRYGVTEGAIAVTAGLFILLVAVHLQRAEPGPALSSDRYPMFPALLAGDLTVLATTRLLTSRGGF
ncbi:MAG: hypothetical protein PF508_19915 [Spirochaeta sp.]|jgi:hypothetical protein|nr:hypothetical protein [Spirochaeta sp.]